MVHPFDIDAEMRAGRAGLRMFFYSNRSWLNSGNKYHVIHLMINFTVNNKKIQDYQT
jgi:hypothetical protein